ncbi:MAG: sigma-70 family RNA polymerase sigma factor [Bacteroidota bacterium]
MDLQQIISSIKANDNKAFTYLYTEYGDYCVNSLIKYRGCNEEDAEDLFIDAVMVFRTKIQQDQIKQITSLKNYLYKICENNYLARLKSDKGKLQKQSDVAFYFYESDYVMDHEVEFQEEMNKVTKTAWNTLSEKCKDIIHFFYIDKLRMEEIASLMGLSNANVAKTTKARCYRQFVDEARTLAKSAGL